MSARQRRGASRSRTVLLALADTLHNAPPAWVRAALGSLHSRVPSRHAHYSGERTMMDKLRKDIRFGLRAWRRRPGFAAVALVTLALGVGVNTVMFSIVNGVLVRALPFRHADRLVLSWGRTPPNPQPILSFAEFQEFRRENGTFDEVALWLTQSVNLTGNGEPQRITGSFVSGTFFDVVGLSAERGRLFSQSESEPGSVKMVTVITHHFWHQRYNGDPS